MTTGTALNDVFTTTSNIFTTTAIKDYINDCIINTPSNTEEFIYGYRYNCKNTSSDSKPDSKPRMFYQAKRKQYEAIRFGKSKENSIYIMPEFSDVRIIRNKENSPIGVKISFADGTEQKAICMPDDTFSLEHGITICLFKKMLTCGCYIDEQYVTGVYNKLVKHAIKVRENRLKAEEEAKKAKEEAKLQEQRFQEKRRKTKAKRAKRASERRINEMAEAIKRSGVVPNIDKIDDGK